MNHLPSSSPLAKDLMNHDAVPLKPGKFEKDLALQFLSGLYCGWPVADSNGKILGVITELRLLQAVSRVKSLDDLRVEDTMTTPVYVYEHDSLNVVLNVMVQRQVLRMPVVREGNLVGVISRGQILRHCLPFFSSPSRVVPSCVWWENVQNLSEESAVAKGWKHLRAFLSINQLSFSDIDLTPTYCPSCLQTLQKLKISSSNLSSEELECKEVPARLLVVDDDPSVAEMLCNALHEWGYDVIMARNGREGLDTLNRRDIDGILLDVHMPLMDGRTMLDELRWLGHQMPVLMMSGESDERVLRQLLQEGAQGFFLKPLHLTSLKQICLQIFSKNEVNTISHLSSMPSEPSAEPAMSADNVFLKNLTPFSVERAL